MTKESNQLEDELTLRTLREAAELTRPELSKRMNIGTRIIANWESGEKLPRVDKFLGLARELNVSLKTLAKAMKLDVKGIPDNVDAN
ncbi:MAG: XRE family transcriptional regulator [Cyanobacteria bacterium QH_8_48_120]|jgi:transcriptional regulator with XRE-family HTH domain|nr:MAG: XRE family transcriptional regulator [Cyanobacteria bacterium QH_8_48_120]PSP04317.1 MAG: XRE family transcriptional regulator [Cyanobacteria bacterium SW_7_48_12]